MRIFGLSEKKNLYRKKLIWLSVFSKCHYTKKPKFSYGTDDLLEITIIDTIYIRRDYMQCINKYFKKCIDFYTVNILYGCKMAIWQFNTLPLNYTGIYYPTIYIYHILWNDFGKVSDRNFNCPSVDCQYILDRSFFCNCIS